MAITPLFWPSTSITHIRNLRKNYLKLDRYNVKGTWVLHEETHINVIFFQAE